MRPWLLMEDHGDAYGFWLGLGVRGATCLHVDAHLDVSNLGIPNYDGAELHCANFLYPAIREGIVSHLVWVVPPVAGSLLEWTRAELQNWMWLSLAEYGSLHFEGTRVEGRLAGAAFTVCVFDDLPALAHPLLLDVDIDYFLGPDDGLWQTPETICAAVPPDFDVLTVAYSVLGGYTPESLRWLGPRVVECLTGVAPVTEPFSSSPFDRAAFYFQRGDFHACLARLEGLHDDPALYLQAFCAFRLGQHERAVRLWQRLPASAHVLEMRGRAGEGVPAFQAALKLEPGRASLWQLLAGAQEAAGDASGAMRSLRKAVRLEGESLASLAAHRQLARLYRQSGQVALAQAEEWQLKSKGAG